MAYRVGLGASAALLLAGHASAFSLNVSSCPGYTLQALQNTSSGFTAALTLAGPACNAFGSDIANLTIEVSYESQERLHVNIFDTANAQFTLPEDLFARPRASNSSSFQQSGDLEFNFNAEPFEFWITRRGDAEDAVPLFDTRKASLPSTPIPPLNDTDSRTAIDGVGLVFEDQYLQVRASIHFIKSKTESNKLDS